MISTVGRGGFIPPQIRPSGGASLGQAGEVDFMNEVQFETNNSVDMFASDACENLFYNIFCKLNKNYGTLFFFDFDSFTTGSFPLVFGDNTCYC